MPKSLTARGALTTGVVILCAVLTACGGGGTTAPTPTTSTVTTTLPTQPFNGLAPDEAAFTDVTVNGTGVLTSTADWTFPTNDIDIYVTATSCRARSIIELVACPAMGRTTAVTAKPERLTVNVTQGVYRVWVANFGPTAESGTLQLTATVAR